MLLDVVENFENLTRRLRIVVFAEKPQATGTILVDQSIHALHQVVLILLH